MPNNRVCDCHAKFDTAIELHQLLTELFER